MTWPKKKTKTKVILKMNKEIKKKNIHIITFFFCQKKKKIWGDEADPDGWMNDT